MKLVVDGAKIVPIDGQIRLEAAQPWEQQDGESNLALPPLPCTLRWVLSGVYA